MEGGGETVNITFNIHAMDGKDAARVIAEQEETIKGVMMRALNKDGHFATGMRRRLTKEGFGL